MSMKNNPLLAEPSASTHSAVAIAGHPIHPMLVAFPIAYVIGTLACDAAYWWTRDPFWAKMALWVIGAGLVMGSLASIVGMMDFMLVHGIRKHVTSWSHFIAAIMLVSLTAANLWLRVPDPEAAVLPWGLFLSCVSALSLSWVGWLGGRLVFEHNVGSGKEEDLDH